MKRYSPTQEEIDTLKAKGWHVDNEGWWYPANGGYGRTYREAVVEQERKDKKATR